MDRTDESLYVKYLGFGELIYNNRLEKKDKMLRNVKLIKIKTSSAVSSCLLSKYYRNLVLTEINRQNFTSAT